MYIFQLGREFKLSLAEIFSVFPEGKTICFDHDFLILDNLQKENILKKAPNLGGTIKIGEIINESILSIAEKSEGKFKYGISIFGEKKNLRDILIKQKKELKANNISSRFINKDFKNLSSAQIIGEKLIKSGSDFSFIFSKTNPSPSVALQGLPLKKEDNVGLTFLGKTIWIQDINAYSKRDYSKDRDMQVGMLPPKLSQMMINISSNNPLCISPLSGEKNCNHIIYDPFVGLGTVLIESILIGNKKVFGSDLNPSMVEKTTNNINNFLKENNIELEEFKIEKLNAKFINESDILNKTDSIVTEGYLGEIMTRKNINIDRIKKQRESLILLYQAFFSNLQKAKYSGNIVICFPFWEIKGKYFYFEEIYTILDKYCTIEKLIPESFTDISTTKAGSLLYKRDKQLVGREVFKLTIK